MAADGKDGLNVRGAITYNGTPLDAFNVRRTAAYVDQVDNHIAELTVRETLGFAAASQGAGVLPGAGGGEKWGAGDVPRGCLCGGDVML